MSRKNARNCCIACIASGQDQIVKNWFHCMGIHAPAANTRSTKSERGGLLRANFFVESHASWHRGHSNVTWPVISRRICSSSVAGWRHFSSWENNGTGCSFASRPHLVSGGHKYLLTNNYLNSSMSHWPISDSCLFYGLNMLALVSRG